MFSVKRFGIAKKDHREKRNTKTFYDNGRKKCSGVNIHNTLRDGSVELEYSDRKIKDSLSQTFPPKSLTIVIYHRHVFG